MRVYAGGVQHQEQQDAQEFLHFLLDNAHEELLTLRKALPSSAQHGGGSDGGGGVDPAPAAAAGAEDEWAQVGKGRKHKAVVTRQAGTVGVAGAARSSIDAIFSGGRS